jgi:hypothetical protein
VRDAPILQNTSEASVGIVVNHDDRSTAEVKLFHNAEPDPLKPTHNHVIAHLEIHV